MSTISQFDDMAAVKSLLLEHVSIQASRRIGIQAFSNMKASAVDNMCSHIAGEIVLQIEASLYGANSSKYEWSVTHPKSWWDHLKHDIHGWKRIPLWMKRRIRWGTTVRTGSVKVYENVCPHIASDREHHHVEFLSHGMAMVPGQVSLSWVIRMLRFFENNARTGYTGRDEMVANAFANAADYVKAEHGEQP